MYECLEATTVCHVRQCLVAWWTSKTHGKRGCQSSGATHNPHLDGRSHDVRQTSQVIQQTAARRCQVVDQLIDGPWLHVGVDHCNGCNDLSCPSLAYHTWWRVKDLNWHCISWLQGQRASLWITTLGHFSFFRNSFVMRCVYNYK